MAIDNRRFIHPRAIGAGLLLISIGMSGIAKAECTSGCVETADVFVSDETFSFFSPITQNLFKKAIGGVDSLAWICEELGIEPVGATKACDGNDFKGP
ncbi:uncharacterized protein METZ01_LOCUS319608, partial [marine metagenome]